MPVVYVHERKTLDFASLEAALSQLPEHTHIVLDEEYSRYADTQAYQEIISNLRPVERLSDAAAVLYITASQSSPKLASFLYSSKVQVTVYDASANTVISEEKNFYSLISQRLQYIDAAKRASVFGILIYSIPIFNNVKSRLISVLKMHNKEYYLIHMGKVSPQKLMNFAEVDVFIRVACPFARLPDNHLLYRPVISPFEFECSLTDSFPSDYETDYQRCLMKPFPGTEEGEPETAISVLHSEAASRFAGRSFKGLADNQDVFSPEIKEGKSGFAQHYDQEGSSGPN